MSKDWPGSAGLETCPNGSGTCLRERLTRSVPGSVPGTVPGTVPEKRSEADRKWTGKLTVHIYNLKADGPTAETGCTGPLCQLTGPLINLPVHHLNFVFGYLAPIRGHLSGHLSGRIFYMTSKRLKSMFLPPVFFYLMDLSISVSIVGFPAFHTF